MLGVSRMGLLPLVLDPIHPDLLSLLRGSAQVESGLLALDFVHFDSPLSLKAHT